MKNIKVKLKSLFNEECFDAETPRLPVRGDWLCLDNAEKGYGSALLEVLQVVLYDTGQTTVVVDFAKLTEDEE